ncbi:BMP family lipoprotein [Streptomyces spiramenti]|uniref:BMP family ABC transporter substrate-binding protein n=1 Tax=Streptomyces spiramenti TaxID=2720606 RepID=A0ABX1AQD1_9ACTN|nr:BMP family ABC transporter substrate-binding protein [Streptomyces spiramenti]NJP66470.1 BMP family ABC transporter substrate-binding protein [Streptomyces spiramenti]
MRRVSKLAATVAATAALALTASACGSDDSTGSGGSSSGGTGEGAAIAFDVGGRDDASFNEAAARGADKAEDELGVETYYQTARDDETDADREQRLQQMAEAGYNPVVGVGYLYGPSVERVAQEFPDTTFGVVDAVAEGDNVYSMIFAEHEASYLAGVAAALKSETGKVGFIGGVDTTLINKFQAGYEQGAKDTDPEIEVDVQYLYTDDPKGFTDVAKAKEQANGMLGRDVDVIYTAAGLAGNGSIEEVASAENAWAIGVDSDQAEQPGLAEYKDSILTSAIKGVDVAVFDLISSIENDDPMSGMGEYGLANDGVWLATSGGHIDDIADELEEAKRRIVEGETEVSDTP